jgi:hypothetical protein
MPLARDVDMLDERWNEPNLRSTGLPEVRGFETTRDSDGELRKVSVKVRLPSKDHHDCHHRPTVLFAVEGSTATPRNVEGKTDLILRTQLMAVLAATAAVEDLPGVQAVETVADLAADIADVEPANGELSSTEDDQ